LTSCKKNKIRLKKSHEKVQTMMRDVPIPHVGELGPVDLAACVIPRALGLRTVFGLDIIYQRKELAKQLKLFR
jgi:hypothetical protein